MDPDPYEIESVLNLLSQTLSQIASMSILHDDERLIFKEGVDDWSVNDILAHLRSCADAWGKSILTMITQEHPTLRYISPRTWIRKTNYPLLEFRVSLESFTIQRKELLE